MQTQNHKMIYYGILLFLAVVLGLLFELHLVFLIIIVAIYMLCVPRMIFNQEKLKYETARFNDVNLYMSQMAQSFVYTGDVIVSLMETVTCFSEGAMHDTLGEAIEIIEAGKWNIKMAERDALALIESKYDCERLRNLHAFFLNAEEIGGECKKEFKILESMRMAWQGVVEEIRLRKILERNIGVIVYAFFLLICVAMLHIMQRSDLDIVNLLATQIVSLFLLLVFVLYFLFMDNRLNKSLLVNPTVMSEETANAYFEYLEGYDSKKERKKYTSFAILSLVVAALLLYNSPDLVALAIAICIVFAGCNVHTLVHISAVRMMRAEIVKAFPKWLFDLMLLLQRESVEGAIEKSLDTAPPVLKRELARITEILSLKPHDPHAYMSFLKDFNNQSISEIMHKLYSLAVGANRDSEVLDVVIEKNIKNLEKAERAGMMLKDSMKSFTWIPFLCAGFACIGYLVIAIVTSINGIIDLVG